MTPEEAQAVHDAFDFSALMEAQAEINRQFQEVLRGFQRLAWAMRLHDYEANGGRARPDGRLRRTGHKHRGTRAWRSRYSGGYVGR